MSSKARWNVACDFDIAPLADAIIKGTDTFILCYDDVSEWNYVDEDDEVTIGRLVGEWASFDEQLAETKLSIVRQLGYDVQDSRLRVTNHRGDRYCW